MPEPSSSGAAKAPSYLDKLREMARKHLPKGLRPVDTNSRGTITEAEVKFREWAARKGDDFYNDHYKAIGNAEAAINNLKVKANEVAPATVKGNEGKILDVPLPGREAAQEYLNKKFAEAKAADAERARQDEIRKRLTSGN